MDIAANDAERILSRQRRDPQIVFGDRPPLLSEIVADSRVMEGRIQADRKNGRLVDEQVKYASEVRLLARPHQAVSIFADDDGRKVMLLFERENFGDRFIATKKS
jgi:hypothetical protein